MGTLWNYYQNAANVAPRTQDPRRPSEKAARWQKSADDILDVALKAAEARHEAKWASYWADTAVRRAKEIKDPKARYELLQRVLRGMSWVDHVPRLVHAQLGPACVELERWDEALASHRYLIEHPQKASVVWVPDPWDIQHRADVQASAPERAMDEELESLHAIGWIQQHHLKQPEEARRTYQDIVDRFGLLHASGPAIADCLHELGKEPVFPPKAALVWGGKHTTQKTWDAVLGPMGFKTHMVGQYTVSEAHLAPYPLVVLARPGMIPYSPDDVLRCGATWPRGARCW